MGRVLHFFDQKLDQAQHTVQLKEGALHYERERPLKQRAYH